MGIQESDYIFSIKGDASTDQNLVTLVTRLQSHGFNTQARPGLGKSVLVFAKITEKTYSDIASRDSQRSAQFGVTSKDDAPADRLRLIYSFLTSPSTSGDSEGVGLTPGKGKWAFVESVMPNSAFLADKSVTSRAQKAAFSPSLTTTGWLKSHGTQVALYFEFLKFYILALGLLSAVGLVAFVKSKSYSLVYSFISLVWGITFLSLWKKRERTLAKLWGVQNAHKVEELHADLAASPSGSEEKSLASKGQSNKAGQRFLRELAFIPIAIAFVAVLVTYQLSCFVLEIFLSEIYNGPGKIFLTLIPTVLIAGFVPVLTIVYNLVVAKFLNWEGHENNYTRYDSFVVKTFTLNFLTGYVPLLITSFIYLPFAHFIEPELPVIKNLVMANIHHDRYAYKFLSQIKSQREFKINQARLDGQFFYFVVTNQIIQFVLKYGLPLVLPHVLKLVNTMVLGKKEEEIPVDKPEEKEWLSSVRNYAQLPEHNVHNDYRGLCLQFGYLSMFGPVWTLAPLFSLVFNVLTFKLDSLKLTSGKYFRPPVPKRVDSIHPWDVAFFVLAWLGSIISPAVTAFYRHGTKPPKTLGQFAMEKASVNVSSSTYLWMILFASEHLFFLLFFIGAKTVALLSSDDKTGHAVSGSSVNQQKSKTSLKSQGGENSSDWKQLSVEEIKKQARGTGETVSQKRSAANSQSVNKGKSSGVQSSVASTSGDRQGLSNRGDKLEELEKKKAQLERVKQTLEKKQMEAQMDKNDTIITTVDSHGNKIQAIFDGDSHIDMSDVKDVEEKLSKNDKSGKFEKSGKSEKSEILEKSDKPKSSAPASGVKDSKRVPEKGSESEVSDSARGESSEETSASSKPSRKKSLKKFLKRG